MNSTSQKLAVLVLCLMGMTCDAGVRDSAQCAILKPPISSARILNALSDGKAQMLVDCGLNINQGIPLEGALITPLQLAAASGRADFIRQVVKAGADPNYAGIGDDEQLPLELALSIGKYEAAIALLDLGARADYVMPRSRMNALMALFVDDRPGNLAGKMAEDLIKRGAAVNAADFKGNTPLHWSARADNADYAKTLLAHGADACVRNQKGERPSDVVKSDAALRQALALACEAQRDGAEGIR